jgi:P-loop Domain of unknown function (DUF2791)
MVLSIINDLLQNTIPGIGIVFAGTPDLIDAKKGLYSVEALKTRMAGNPFATAERADFVAPTISLAPLTHNELKVLLLQVQNVYAYGDERRHVLTSEDVTTYLEAQFRKLGGELLKRTRDVVKEFVQLLDMLDQYPELDWRARVSGKTAA